MNHDEKTDKNTKNDDSPIDEVTEVFDAFKPLSGLRPYDGRHILTVRAVITGVVLGSVINCSNLYLGHMTGLGADATLFAAIFGYAICKALERSKVRHIVLMLINKYALAPNSAMQIAFLSGGFCPHENNIMKAAALGSIGIGFLFMSGVPAMYQLHLLGSTPESDYGKLIFILQLARQMSLVFPLGTASAVTIQTLHSLEGSLGQARVHIKAISVSFAFSLIWSVGTSYAPGILYTWNPLWWIFKWGGRSVISAISRGWISWSWSPSMIGVGALIDLNVALSYLFGAILSWGVIGPILVSTGTAVGIPYADAYPDLLTYDAFVASQFRTTPSPRYWMLWPAVFMMLGVSLTVVLSEGKNFIRMAKYGVINIKMQVVGHRHVDAHSSLGPERRVLRDEIPDPVASKDQTRWWEWLSVTVISTVFSLVAPKYTLGIPFALNILNLGLGFMWSLVVIQVYGASGTTPITTVAKGSQFITGGILRPEIHQRGYESVARINLAGCLIGSAAAQQAGELCQDFRTGFLLGTPARSQWHAQMIGTSVAAFTSPAIFLLLAKAFPCILDAQATTCQFTLPAVTSWRVITEAIFRDTFPISKSSWTFAIVLSIAGMLSVVFRRYLANSEKFRKWQVWIPNMSLVGLAMTIPGSSVTLTVTLGAVGAHLPHEKFLYPIAAGGIAGEGVGYVVQCALQIAGVAGPGTTLGCVAEMC
ncbi:hypothetical protein JMJ77_0001489 [Colletotrichum scovillei]|uniref:OPT oligopeptide transporter n=1 Tax=Colletotrichum scovillei TaxID=1209932 RepID=A0A9P7QPT1_9PEZI|nr:hypothetical protein JMJ77_0001489 [Colletotrichum scovillei]KAG7060363.1 hypothetical protein JMJ76_0006275 [Colletotrichum scovillei]